jgi:flagellar hook-basal body complex protein FliE
MSIIISRSTKMRKTNKHPKTTPKQSQNSDSDFRSVLLQKVHHLSLQKSTAETSMAALGAGTTEERLVAVLHAWLLRILGRQPVCSQGWLMGI